MSSRRRKKILLVVSIILLAVIAITAMSIFLHFHFKTTYSYIVTIRELDFAKLSDVRFLDDKNKEIANGSDFIKRETYIGLIRKKV